MFHHNIALCHTSFSIPLSFTGKNILVLLQPAFSPDPSLCNFWLFPKFKETMKGKRFVMTEDIISNTTHHLQVIQKKKTSRNIFNSGRSNGTNVCTKEGSTLKGITDEKCI
jgi:hypothetical protein